MAWLRAVWYAWFGPQLTGFEPDETNWDALRKAAKQWRMACEASRQGK